MIPWIRKSVKQISFNPHLKGYESNVTFAGVFALAFRFFSDFQPEISGASRMPEKPLQSSETWIRRVLFVLGAVLVVVGLVRQGPVLGGTYMEFIEGKGYLALITGLIMIVLGFSVPLLIGEDDSDVN